MISLQWLEAFVETAKHGSISKASRALHLTQPAVSRHLSLLESELQAKLYQRTGYGIELTQQGKLILDNAAAILTQITDLKDLLSVRSESAARMLRVGGSYSSAISLLPKLLAHFKKRHPRVEIDLQTGNSRTLSQLVMDRKIEIGVVSAPMTSPLLTVEPYRREKLVLFAHPEYPPLRRGGASKNKGLCIPLIMRHPINHGDVTQRITRAFASRGIDVHVAMRCGSPQAIKEAVRAKAGVGVLFKSTVEAELKRGEFKIFRSPGSSIDAYSFIIYRSDATLSPSAAQFFELLHRYKRA